MLDTLDVALLRALHDHPRAGVLELARVTGVARATVAGAGALAVAEDEDPAALRENVTSPNGTTAAGLSVLMDEGGGLTPLVTRTVAAAAERSRELGQ